jgi:anhydro-N-acetylmuramic acid kinase
VTQVPGRVFAGMMSGSSLDGLDLGVCAFVQRETGLQLQWLFLETLAFPEEMREALHKVEDLDLSTYFLLENEFSLWCGRMYREKVPAEIRSRVEALGTHGHTVMHKPERGLTVQMTNPWVLAKEAGAKLVCDFRRNDVAHGGLGAPLVPVLEQYLLGDFSFFLNLGGIGNLSVHESGSALAFDFCPVNQILNHLSRSLGLAYDPYGQNAARGTFDHRVYGVLEDLDFWNQKPPKTLDNGWIKREVLPRLDALAVPIPNQLHTACLWMVDKLEQALQPWSQVLVSKALYVTGGGAHNSFLMGKIKEKWANNGWREPHCPSKNMVDGKEAALVALLAFLCVNRQVNSFHWVTGAQKDTVNGLIVNG